MDATTDKESMTFFIYDKAEKALSAVEKTQLHLHDVMERRDMEPWVTKHPGICGEDLLIITTEYDRFDKTKERLDLLALDREGKVVVIELKRGESGKGAELQALKYAAYCSTLTMEKLVSLRRRFVAKEGEAKSDDEIKKEFKEFVGDPEFEALDDRPRILLIASEFAPEVTASVLWLRKFGVGVSCVKLTPYPLGDSRIGIVSSKLIPLPEAEEYQVLAEEKERTEGALTRRQQEYIEFYRELAERIRGQIAEALPDPSGLSYQWIPTGPGGVHFEWAFHGRPRSSFGVELHFETGNKKTNRRLLKAMEGYRDRIEQETGENVTFQEDWGKTWSRLYIEKNEGKTTEELKKWAVEKMVILYDLLKPELEKLR